MNIKKSKKNSSEGAFTAELYLDEDGKLVSQSNEITNFEVYPGEWFQYEGRGRVRSGSGIVCDQKISKIRELKLSPDSVNGSPSALNRTFFENASSGLHYEAKNLTRSLDRSENPLGFLLWNPRIGPDGIPLPYSLKMWGDIDCGVYGVFSVVAEANIVVAPQSVPQYSGECASASYTPEENKVKYGGACSFTRGSFVSGDAEFGVLVLLKKFSLGFVSSLSDQRGNFLMHDDIVSLSQPWLVCPNSAVDRGECKGGAIRSENHTTFQPPSFFTAPYLSESCDYDFLHQLNAYSYEAEYSFYVMMKMNVKGILANWVPVASLRSVSITPFQMIAKCSLGVICGHGLGPNTTDPFTGNWTIEGGERVHFSQDDSDVSLPPRWNSFLEYLSDSSQFISLAAYFEGSSGNSWILCPKSRMENSEDVSESVNSSGSGFASGRDESEVLDLDNATDVFDFFHEIFGENN